MRKIFIATGNPHKIQEFKDIFDTMGLDVELVSPKDFNDDSEPVGQKGDIVHEVTVHLKIF